MAQFFWNRPQQRTSSRIQAAATRPRTHPPTQSTNARRRSGTRRRCPIPRRWRWIYDGSHTMLKASTRRIGLRVPSPTSRPRRGCICTRTKARERIRIAISLLHRPPKANNVKTISMFEDFLLYLNHVGLCTEEISGAGEALGNAVQGFPHVTLISAAYNLSRTMGHLHQPAV